MSIKDEINNNYALLDFLVGETTLVPHEPKDTIVTSAFTIESGIARLLSDGATDGKKTGNKKQLTFKSYVSQYHDTISLTPSDVISVKRRILTLPKNSLTLLNIINAIIPTTKNLTDYHLRAHQLHTLFGQNITDKIASGELGKGAVTIEAIKESKPIFMVGTKVVDKFSETVTEVQVREDCGLLSQCIYKDKSFFTYKDPVLGEVSGVNAIPTAEVVNIIRKMVGQIQEIMDTEVYLVAGEEFMSFISNIDVRNPNYPTVKTMLSEFVTIRKCPQLKYIKDFDGFMLIADRKLVKVDMSSAPLFLLDPIVQGLHGKQDRTTNSAVAAPLVYPGAAILINGIFATSTELKGSRNVSDQKSNLADAMKSEIASNQKEISDLKDKINSLISRKAGEEDMIDKITSKLSDKIEDLASAISSQMEDGDENKGNAKNNKNR